MPLVVDLVNILSSICVQDAPTAAAICVLHALGVTWICQIRYTHFLFILVLLQYITQEFLMCPPIERGSA